MLPARARDVLVLAVCCAALPSCSEHAPIVSPSPAAASTAVASASVAPGVVGPAPTLLRDVTAVGAGARHACARLTSGAVVCWGDNDRGQLGEGAAGPSALAVLVPGIEHAAQLSVSPGDFSCVRHDDGGVSCWGHGARRPARIAGIAGATQLATGDGGAVAVSVISTLQLTLQADGSVKSAIFNPPLKPELMDCAGGAIAGKFAEGNRRINLPVTFQSR